MIEESEDDDEDEHMVANSGSFLQPQKSKVKKEMEKFKKDKQKESPKKAAKALKEEPQSPKESGEQVYMCMSRSYKMCVCRFNVFGKYFPKCDI